MPNVNAPNGFTPVRHLSGGVIAANEYRIASGLASNIFAGDLVILKDDGFLDVAAAGSTNCIGVFQGAQWVDVDGTVRFEKQWPSGRATLGAAPARAFVFDDPNIVFQAQTSTCAQTNVGNNADITATAGNTATGMSRQSINMAGAAAATAQIRILGLMPDADEGAFARVECLINEHQLRATAGI